MSEIEKLEDIDFYYFERQIKHCDLNEAFGIVNTLNELLGIASQEYEKKFENNDIN